MSRVVTIGTFDPPHIGHAALIERCNQLGSKVIIGVNSDAFVRQYKGHYPLFNEQERMNLVATLDVAEVHLNHTAGFEFLEEHKPDVLVVGADWYEKDYWTQLDVPRSYFNDHGIELVFFPLVVGLSSSEIKRRASGQEATA